MLGVSRRAGNWLGAVALVGAAAVVGVAGCAAGMPAGAPGEGADGRAIHATPAPRHYPDSPGVLPIPRSILATTYHADVVAHVKLKSARGEAQKFGSSTLYSPEIWFEFEALEYLKGNGGDRIWGLAHVQQQVESEKVARDLAARYIQRIDPLHTGEAIVFMEESIEPMPNTQLKDHYYLGNFGIDYFDQFSDNEAVYTFEEYSLAGYRRWLPLAASDGVSGANEEAQFMLRHPDGTIVRGINYPEDRSYAPEEVLIAAGSPVISVIGLSDLRRIAKNELDLREIRYYSSLAERRVGMAARNLTAEVVGDAIVLRWDMNASLSALGGVKGYRVFRQASVEGRAGFSTSQRLESDVVKLGDVVAVSSSMSYVDRAGVSPGATYIYRVWTLEEDVYVFGEYGAEARVGIVEGAKAVGAVVSLD